MASSERESEVSLDIDAARALAEAACAEDGMVLYGDVEEHAFGWVFPCATAAYAASRDPNHAVPGVGPIAVLRNGELERVGGRPPSLVVRELEARWRAR